MRRLVLWLASTVTVVVLLLSYPTSTNQPTTSSVVTTSGSTTSGSTTSGSTADESAKTTTGSVVSTRWGPVQVQITTVGRTVTAVAVLQQPDGNPRDVEINDEALPVLVAETTAASSADIDMVSGATVTSEGYVQSLQAALDSAGF